MCIQTRIQYRLLLTVCPEPHASVCSIIGSINNTWKCSSNDDVGVTWVPIQNWVFIRCCLQIKRQQNVILQLHMSFYNSLLLTVYMHISDMLGVVEIPLKNVWMKADTSFTPEPVGSASLWSGSISGPVCGQIWNRIQTWCIDRPSSPTAQEHVIR